MADLADLERRIRALEDIEAIRRLKHRYWRCLDLKLWDEMAACFTPDAAVDYGGGRYRFQGVEAILGFLRESLARETGAQVLTVPQTPGAMHPHRLASRALARAAALRP